MRLKKKRTVSQFLDEAQGAYPRVPEKDQSSYGEKLGRRTVLFNQGDIIFDVDE